MKLAKYFAAVFLVGLLGCQSGDSEKQVAQTGGAQLPSGDVLYTIPAGWVEEAPTSSMRRAQYKWPGTEGLADAEIAVFFFPGTGGSVQANLSRWYGQFKQPDGSPTAAVAKSEKRMVKDLPVTITYATGTYLKNAGMMMGDSHPAQELKNYALLAAIVETAHGPWFFKATGPNKTIQHWRNSFDEFVNSFTLRKPNV